MLVTENQLDEWVSGNSREAQGVIVELVWRLVAASSPKPKERRFPLGDSIGQPGPDGILDVDYSFDPFVPEGRSFWEIGTDEKAGDKATEDYKGLISAIPAEIRLQSTFVFVTPRSGRRKWGHTWKEKAQGTWIEKRRKDNDWKDIRVIDGTKLIDWLHHFPSVELWLAHKMGLPTQNIETLDQRWNILRGIGDPPPLMPHVFLTNRDAACAKLEEVFSGKLMQLELVSHFPDQVADFVCAYVASLDDESRADVAGQCLIVSGTDAWNAVVALRQRHILVADPDLDLTGAAGTKLLERARRAGHGVILWGMPGGIPHPYRVPISSPKIYQLREALQKVGYSDERARVLAQKSGGNLGTLLRCLQNLSLMPEWAENTASAELAIAELLGAWDERFEGDCQTAETMAGKPYGEWIEKMREAALRPGTPLSHRDSVWKFSARFEGWSALGARIFDDHLNRFQQTAVRVLREKDPALDLPKEQRFAAAIYGKVASYSQELRIGIAESLALLGSHPKALTSCSVGHAETTAVLAVRDIFNQADWALWASLNNLLPLIAEAAPGEFLSAVENALSSEVCPFDNLFAEEGDSITGTNYTTGLLWALETLAWDPEHLGRVVLCLGELAARDPGGKWANRPANSLRTILLPWLPQTCASITKRTTAVVTLLEELPEVGWKLLLRLLPHAHSISHCTRRPAWRETIPDDWAKGVTVSEYNEQINAYADLAIRIAKADLQKLTQMVDEFEHLPAPAREQFLAHLQSETVITMPESARTALWTELVDLVTKHRKFSNAAWALPSEDVDKIALVTERIAPSAPVFRHQRLFSERDHELYEEKGNYEEQRIKLEEDRKTAIREIALSGGIPLVLSFAESVQSSWRVGVAFGSVAASNVDASILPNLLNSDQKQVTQFVGGFVWGRFRSKGWRWVDPKDMRNWVPEQIVELLTYLPFTPETWERAGRLLGKAESEYWSKANANPYDTETGLDMAVDKLLLYGRPFAAIRCLHKMKLDKIPIDAPKAVEVLISALSSSEGPHVADSYEIVEIIQALQEDPNTKPEDLFRVEWSYLKLLDSHEASPKQLWRQLGNDPSFFCEVVRLVYRSKNEQPENEALSEKRKNIANNAYDLLSKWKQPPGVLEDGSFDGAALVAWLEAVKKECAESGHLEAAMTVVGHVLYHAPADPDGLWIHRAAAKVLNAKDAADMREGYRTEAYNSRGVFTFTGGQEERTLAVIYKSQADSVEAAGYNRLATSLRKLAASYEREAERESSRSPFGD